MLQKVHMLKQWIIRKLTICLCPRLALSDSCSEVSSKSTCISISKGYISRKYKDLGIKLFSFDKHSKNKGRTTAVIYIGCSA